MDSHELEPAKDAPDAGVGAPGIDWRAVLVAGVLSDALLRFGPIAKRVSLLNCGSHCSCSLSFEFTRRFQGLRQA